MTLELDPYSLPLSTVLNPFAALAKRIDCEIFILMFCVYYFYTQNLCLIMKIISIKTFIFQIIFSTTVLVSRLHPREDGAFVDRREDEDLLGWIRCDPLRLKILTPWRLFGL